MKSANNMVVVATMAALAFASAAAAQVPDLELGRKWCGPTGTWIGQNDTYGLELVLTIEPMSGTCFSIVAEGIEKVLPWEVSTAWRGVVKKNGGQSYSTSMVTLAGPNQLTNPKADVPDIAAVRGELYMPDCDHLEIEFEPTELYAWCQVPFEDTPLATMPPSIAHYTRVPFDCLERPD
jgi:hypothetical protein